MLMHTPWSPARPAPLSFSFKFVPVTNCVMPQSLTESESVSVPVRASHGSKGRPGRVNDPSATLIAAGPTVY